MWKWLIVLVLCAAPLAAAAESNFGRVILDKSDLIVQGVASATHSRVGAAFKVEVTVQDVLYGKEDKTDVSMFCSNPKELGDKALCALFALKRLADGGYKLVGKPVATRQDDPERDDKLRVCRDYINLEAMQAGDKRTEAFWNLLSEHVLLGGYPAQNAAVELMYVARDRGGIITEARFDSVVKARDNALSRLTTQCKDDLKLAFQGLVEAKIKNLKFRKVRRGKTGTEKREAAKDLNNLQEKYPRAFIEEDAKLCDALVEVSSDDRLVDSLKVLARNIRADIRIREADKRKKDADARKKIEHAGR